MSIIDIRVINILIIGDTMSGKTCLLDNYFGLNNMLKYATIGTEYRIKKINSSDNVNYSLKIWDSSGAERYRSLLLNLLKNMKGIILVYSIDNEYTFNNIKNQINSINDYIDISKTPIILVGNKKDLENKRIISEEEGRKIAEDYNFKFYETSAKTGENVNEIFQKLFEITVKNLKNQKNNNNKNNNNNHKNNNNKDKNNNKIDKEGKCLII